MTAQILTQELLKELLHYDPETGYVYFKRRSENHFASKRSCRSWNTKHGGRKVSSINGNGYGQIAILGGRYPLHRIIYMWMTGSLPEHEIDHINGITSDNRWENLRACTTSQNGMNKSIPSNNISGRIGVYKHSLCNRWVANIRINNKTIYLGIFKDIESAINCRRKAEIELGFHPNHGRAS
jgi:hypothetical protein